MPNSHGAHPPLPPLRDLTLGGGEESHEDCQGGAADCPTAPDSPSQASQCPSGCGWQGIAASSHCPPWWKRWDNPVPHALYCRQRPHSSHCGLTSETREVLNPVREAGAEAADTPTHPRYPRFCKNPIVNPFVARALRGWNRPFQPAVPTRDLAQRRGPPDRHLRPRRRH
ncbi:hypothetical protein P7K49_003050 [Saguinus oedipus]|uniref:Uncharacterized protein n=1 Tax=Saguinus oedipus TaxID=9490 RepID=A0ABQ9WJ32_SAGOE|nr:hypothetical protein P7K49_003050 [Saguinus oedipus]